ncbi:hypothetical protein APR04_005028 [Promicromonospora umidemergens]|uniref:Integral membrane protein n=1 Tax=Promicromonospora umidemergens TaxID=629679 RepID=A0ABP8X2Y4_9MICO|nr:hypothetical protein [Promicromonospora umidemergens]MCP2286092.1 hypothetical protein [Promicromonospora umidemergens]
MSRPARSRPELVVAGAIGGGLIVWVLVVFGTVLFTGTGTGDFLDPWRALWRVLMTGSTWLIAAGGAVVGGMVGAVVGGPQNKKK